MAKDDSWWLKVKRAQRHMVEIRSAVRLYSESHPYQLVRVKQSKRNRERWDYQLVFTEQPDPMIAVMLGDFVHNLRSALDHITVACSAPKYRKSAMFPISFNDIWKTDDRGRFAVADDEARTSFAKSFQGLSMGARAVVLKSQPYMVDEHAADHLLGIISRLENADKHRRLITVGNVLQAPFYDVVVEGKQVLGPSQLTRNQFVRAGAMALGFKSDDPLLPESEVKVDYRGTATVSIKVTGIRGNEPPFDHSLTGTMVDSLSYVRRLLRDMEPYVRQ